MALDSGTRLGVYEITAPLGSGGMGEVYRARDTKLGRDVALKILPDEFAADPERLARFEREAQVLASLNHPNIAAIHGFEESNGVRALVLELVEGPTLAERLAQGSGLTAQGTAQRGSGPGPKPSALSHEPGPSGLPLDEVLSIARQICEALAAAHEHGIIHRDLKPANIKVREDSTVKVLDFGLAKALEPAVAGNVSMSPTLSVAATQAGMILGTAAYMAPEQARGKPADKRADIWAFGCMLYEMLAGTRAFDGEDVAVVLASVIKGEPDWAALRADVSTPIVTLLKRCLVQNWFEELKRLVPVN